MLALDKPITSKSGIMIYGDHENPELFYYANMRPRLARTVDGKPEFVYMKYRRDITDNPDFQEGDKSLGGGFLAFTVDLSLTEDEVDEIKDAISDATGASGDRLVPIQFRKGEVRLTLTKDEADVADAGSDPPPRGMRFVEDIYGASKPSLLGDNRATFAVTFPQEAATLFEAGIRTGISPIGVIYDLEFLGIRPAFDVKITAEYKRIYTSLELGFSARGGYPGVVSAAATADLAFQKLRDSGAVKVEVLNFTDDDDIKKQADEAWKYFKGELLKDFFKSSIPAPSFMQANAGGSGMLGQLQNLLGPLGGAQQGTTTNPIAGNANNAQVNPQVAGQTTTQPTGSTQPPRANNQTAQANQTAPSGASSQTGGVAAAPFQVGISLKYMKQEELKTRTFRYSMQAAAAQKCYPQGLFSTIADGLRLDRQIIEVDLDDDFFKKVVANVSMGVDLAAVGVSKVAVNLDYPGERTEDDAPTHVGGFLFDSANTEAQKWETWINDDKDLSYRYHADVHWLPSSEWEGRDASNESGWIQTRRRQLLVNPLDLVALHEIQVSLGDMSTELVTQVQAHLIYEDAANDFKREKSLLLEPGSEPLSWKLRLSDPQALGYRYQLTYVLKDNTRYVTEWRETANPTLVVNEPFENTLNVRLFPVFDATELMEAVVNLTYAEPETGYTSRHEEVFQPGERSRSVSIPTLLKEPAPLSVEITGLKTDMSPFSIGPIETTERVIVLSDGAGSVRSLKVRLVGPTLEAANLVALKVDFIGPGEENPDTDSALFTPSNAEEKAVSIAVPPEATFGFTWRATAYNNLGVPSPAGEGQGTTTAPLLITVPSGT